MGEQRNKNSSLPRYFYLYGKERMTTQKLDFSKLFLYKHKLEIIDSSGEVVGKVYQRILNDADLEYARAQALRASGQFRAKLREDGSEENFAYLSSIYDLIHDEMVAHILIQELSARRERLQTEIPPRVPPKPEPDASLEQQEEYLAKMDKVEIEWIEAINERLEKELEQRRKELSLLQDDDLRLILKRAMINRLCNLRMVNVFQSYCAYLGTYADSKCKINQFDSFEEFEQAPSEVIGQLVDGYFKLGLDAAEIKK
jgi:hypothetical protein